MIDTDFLTYVKNYFKQSPSIIKSELFSEKLIQSQKIIDTLLEKKLSDETENEAIEYIFSTNFISEKNFIETINLVEKSQNFKDECNKCNAPKNRQSNEYKTFLWHYLNNEVFPFRYDELYDLVYVLWYFYHNKRN